MFFGMSLLSGLFSIVVWMMYKKSGIPKACVMSMGFLVLGIYLDTLFQLIMQAFMGMENQEYMMQLLGMENQEYMMQLLGMVISKSIQGLALLGMKVFAKEGEEQAASSSVLTSKTVQKEAGDQNNRDAGWQYYDGLTVAISAFFLLLGVATWWKKAKVVTKISVMLVLLLVLVVYYLSLYIHQRLQKAKATRSEAESKKHEAEMYLESVENNYQRTRELWHDLKNHINLMNLLLQEEKYGELKDYLRIFGEDVDSLTLPVKSGNVIVDALLADKLNKARHEKVEVSLYLCNLTELKLKPDEICGLLGNLLDNALEANLRLREGRTLEVTCKELEECYYIRVRNPVSGSGGGNGVVARQAASREGLSNREAAPEARIEFPKTTKSDRRNKVGHGLGLRSVERIVHGCGGELAVDIGEKYFTVVVRLPR